MNPVLVDMLWILLCAGLVFLMQGGFLCLESGLTRSKNSINVAFKNVIDFGIAVFLYWAVSYGLMFGATAGGWFGTSGFLFAPTGSDAPMLFSVFVFQAMFCATGATIISGATAERLKFYAYVLITIIYCVIVYPFVGHWVWSTDVLGEPMGWLAKMGFHDFAGSSVVHSSGGWVALAVVLIIGPRLGRFGADGKAVEIPGSNMPLAMLGAIILFFGWFGFNGGSVLGFTDAVPLIIMNTLLGGVSGMCAMLAFVPFYKKLPDPGLVMNGAIAGLVAVTANCDWIGPVAALIIGAVGALIMLGTTHLLEKFKIDDAIGAIPAHLTPGIWGTLAVAFFADPAVVGAEINRAQLFQTQLTGVVMIGFWSFVLAYVFLRVINRVFHFRVDAESEHQGLNISEHGARTETIFLLEDMERHARTGDLSERVRIEPFTEVGQIARQYNKVIDALDMTMNRLKSIFHDLNDGLITFSKEGLLTSINPMAGRLLGLQPATAAGMPVWDVITAAHLNNVEAHQPENQAPVDIFRTGEVQEIHLKQIDTRKNIIFEFLASEGKYNNEVVYTGLIRDISETYHSRRSRNRVMSKLFGAQKLQLYALMCRQALPDIRRSAGDIVTRLRHTTADLSDLGGVGNEVDIGLLHAASKAKAIEELTRDLQHLEETNRLPGQPLELDAFLRDLLQKGDLAKRHPVLAKVGLELIPGGSEFQTLAAPRYLTQAISNLVLFAAHHTGESGIVSVTTLPVYLDQPILGTEMVPAGEYMKIEIRDNGKGLSEEQVDQIFAAGKDESNFAMVLSEAMIHYMGGHLTVESALGEGSVFHLYLPIARPAARPVTHIDNPKGSVLVIDDHPDQLNLIADLFREDGYRVFSAADSNEALRQLGSETVDLVLLDLVLGRDARNANGIFQRIRRNKPDVPVLVTGGNPDKELLAELIQAGAAGFLPKPVSPARLLRLAAKEMLGRGVPA